MLSKLNVFNRRKSSYNDSNHSFSSDSIGSGIFRKKGSNVKNWKLRRYEIYSDGFLHYFGTNTLSKSPYDSNGFINCIGCKIIDGNPMNLEECGVTKGIPLSLVTVTLQNTTDKSITREFEVIFDSVEDVCNMLLLLSKVSPGINTIDYLLQKQNDKLWSEYFVQSDILDQIRIESNHLSMTNASQSNVLHPIILANSKFDANRSYQHSRDDDTDADDTDSHKNHDVARQELEKEEEEEEEKKGNSRENTNEFNRQSSDSRMDSIHTIYPVYNDSKVDTQSTEKTRNQPEVLVKFEDVYRKDSIVTSDTIDSKDTTMNEMRDKDKGMESRSMQNTSYSKLFQPVENKDELNPTPRTSIASDSIQSLQLMRLIQSKRQSELIEELNYGMEEKPVPKSVLEEIMTDPQRILTVIWMLFVVWTILFFSLFKFVYFVVMTVVVVYMMRYFHKKSTDAAAIQKNMA